MRKPSKITKPHPNTMAFLQTAAATAYVVEYDSHVGGQRNDATFGEFPRDVYENAWQRLNVKPERGGHELNALLGFVLQERWNIKFSS